MLLHLRSVFFASTQEDGSESSDSLSDGSESPDEYTSISDQLVSGPPGSRDNVGVPGIRSWVTLLNIPLLFISVVLTRFLCF